MTYTGAPDECSSCFSEGKIQKLDNSGECPNHPIISEGWVDHPECNGVHHVSYRHCVVKAL